ncbi:MAG: hypothetical protein ATN35_00605 [Epulopiscium sp. Nele67-Bin004]|nr:MAG: hypothetical protein ATN35_00605 [Epulopiscium sp. Nele67-Bin004]
MFKILTKGSMLLTIEQCIYKLLTEECYEPYMIDIEDEGIMALLTDEEIDDYLLVELYSHYEKLSSYTRHNIKSRSVVKQIRNRLLEKYKYVEEYYNDNK